MSYIPNIEFANYTLTFGEDKVLLDLFTEIVAPSFEDQKYTRHTGPSSWFFLNSKMIILREEGDNPPIIGVTGRIVKKTKLRRTQTITPDSRLMEDQQELDSAPSSIFLLILNNHRLLFCREMPDAPDIKNFCATSRFCLRRSRQDYINKKSKDISIESGIKLAKAKRQATLDVPPPNLRLTPLIHEEELASFLSRFEVVNKLTIKLLKTNNEEIDMDDFWQYFNNKKSALASETAKAEFSSSSGGMDKEAVKREALRAGVHANSEIKIYGLDGEGDHIKGDNNDFSFRSEIRGLSKSIEAAATQMFNRLDHLVKSGHIFLPAVPSSVTAKIRALIGPKQ